MTQEARFEVEVTGETPGEFARLSGDWNPLHTNPEYARKTPYGRPVLHGAFSAGLFSRLAGMHLPGTECLLHDLRLRFIAPIVPPARLRVEGKIISDNGGVGRVEASVSDVVTGQRYVEGGYEFGRHETSQTAKPVSAGGPPGAADGQPIVLVTGASGGLGQAFLTQLGASGVGTSRQGGAGMVQVTDPERVAEAVRGRKISAIVHCAWPSPDNTQLIGLNDPGPAVEHHVAGPLRQCLALARLIAEQGTPDAMLVLIGSTAADPGRHNYRMPMYTLGKSLIPTLARILALELGASERRVSAVVFDVLETGMNQRLSRTARQAHADRSPSGRLPDAAEAAGQIAWLLQNRSFLVSGATVTLSGGALP